MPGYGKKSMYASPEPTEKVDTIEKRFAMPKVTIVQMVILVAILAYAWTARKMNGVVVSSLVFFVGVLHLYDHLYRVKRGPEHLFFLPKKEGYKGGCSTCSM
jgi:ethanolamine ammonia-lyase large subunit